MQLPTLTALRCLRPADPPGSGAGGDAPVRADLAQRHLIVLAFFAGVLAGARRFAHLTLLQADAAIRQLFGLRRFPSIATVTRFFRRFSAKTVTATFEHLLTWCLDRLPARPQGYTLDLDSTVFERYGEQEGARKGYNPRKRGRPSHHPLFAVLAEARCLTHAWLRSGNAGASRGAPAFFAEVQARLAGRHRLALVRADSGFFAEETSTHALHPGLEGEALPFQAHRWQCPRRLWCGRNLPPIRTRGVGSCSGAPATGSTQW